MHIFKNKRGVSIITLNLMIMSMIYFILFYFFLFKSNDNENALFYFILICLEWLRHLCRWANFLLLNPMEHRSGPIYHLCLSGPMSQLPPTNMRELLTGLQLLLSSPGNYAWCQCFSCFFLSLLTKDGEKEQLKTYILDFSW